MDALQCGKESSFTEFYEAIVRRLTLPLSMFDPVSTAAAPGCQGKDATIPLQVMGTIVPLPWTQVTGIDLMFVLPPFSI